MNNRNNTIQEKKHDLSVRSMYFSRYLMIRYFTAIYLFTNLFWLIFAVSYQSLIGSFFAGVIFILIILASIEQASKWHKKDSTLKYTKVYYLSQFVYNVVLIPLCLTPLRQVVFPFSESNDVAMIIISILLLGMVGCLMIFVRIRNIQNGRDKYLKAIKTFENNQQ